MQCAGAIHHRAIQQITVKLIGASAIQLGSIHRPVTEEARSGPVPREIISVYTLHCLVEDFRTTCRSSNHGQSQ